ncbi:MAG: ATPase domain-containing protein, partial [Candidatus Bathyarchaeota archaeon]
LQHSPEWYQFSASTFHSLSIGLYRLAETITSIKEKERILIESLSYKEKAIRIGKKFFSSKFYTINERYREKSQIQITLAELADNNKKKNILIKAAELSINTCINGLEKNKEDLLQEWSILRHGNNNYQVGRILHKLYSLTKKQTLLNSAIDVFNTAIKNYEKTEHDSNLAECYWQKGKIQNLLNDHLSAAKNYELASRAYLRASDKFPKLKEFYLNHSKYMQAWTQIEQAKYHHSREDYIKASSSYQRAGKLHEELENWNYLSSNYFAWSKIEQAEEMSRIENPQKAIQNFQDAIEYFKKTEYNIKPKIEENLNSEEKGLIIRILKASDFRQKYCQARIRLEEAKILDRKGKYFQSAKNYDDAAQKIESIIEELESQSDKKELSLLVILCQAWQKMALAEDQASSDYYLEAAKLFEKAKELGSTNRTRLWTLGNSSFCKGLAAKNKFQNTLERSFYSIANKYVNQAADYYSKAGFQFASEYAKATQRLFDAYLYIKNAEGEVEPEKKTKYYQISEQLLQIAADSFLKAKQPEKTTQVQEILINVREEKALAFSLSQVMQAPIGASSTLSFSAPTPSSEVSVGLEGFEHANVQANLVTQVKEVKVGESFCLSVEFVNAGRESALLMRVEDFLPKSFVIVKKPEIYRLEDTCLNMKGKQLAPLKLVEVNLILQPSKKGIFQFNPKVHYLDESGQNKLLQLKNLEITVKQPLLPDRVSTGTTELDALTFGGFPSEYAVVLTGSPSDERDYIIKNFLEAATKEDETVFYVSTKADNLEKFLKNPNFNLFLCDPKSKTKIQDSPNVYKLRSKTDLTNLSISLTKAYRNLDSSTRKRMCIETVSDVLITHKVEATRRWISELITDFGAKGFTMLET